MNTHFLSIFKKSDAPIARGKYLSRIFGIFSEEIVRIWAGDHHCAYEDMGRPTLRKIDEKQGSTLDFTLHHKATGKSYVAELKCEIEYQNYKYFVLSDVNQLAHHRKAAFTALLNAAEKCPEQQTYVGGKKIDVDGAILIWGSATDEGKRTVIKKYGFSDILTMAEIIHDLRSWKSEPYQDLIKERRYWSNEMFDALLNSND
jgi:IS1 family transposase